MYSDGLEAYFTDVEHLRDFFRQTIAAPELPKRLLVIHGVGGVGKSSLLRMFRLYCKGAQIPVGLVSGDEAKSVVDILADWSADLKAAGVTLKTLTKTLAHYRTIQAKVSKQTQETVRKVATKTVEAAASVIPGIGPLAGALGGAGAEALVDWLRGFLPQADVDLLLDPTGKLTSDLLADMARAAAKQRLVLMVDTFEQLTALDDWVRELAQQLHPNVLLVITGRAVPNWSRQWPGWLAQARIEELTPMTEEAMRELAHRYYATMYGGEPDAQQVAAIIRFARGLPMVVTSAVRLWIQYGIEDFQAVKPQVVADLVDRLMEGVPQEMRPLLEAAATVRWFNKEILRALTAEQDVTPIYDELRRFPFVRPRAEGLALHDTVREMIDENLKVHDPERHRELHEKAAVCFEARLEKVTGQDKEHLRMERLYHRICSDEKTGGKLFQEMAEELTRTNFVNQLRVLLNDVNSYPLQLESSQLWREYYNASLLSLEGRHFDAERAFEAIGGNEHAEPKLRAYALHDLGQILAKFGRLGQSGVEKATRALEQSLSIAPTDDYLITGLRILAHICAFQGQWSKGEMHLDAAKRYFEERQNYHGLASIYLAMRDIFAFQGDFKAFLALHELISDVLSKLPQYLHLKASLGHWAWAWALAGRYAEAEHLAREGVNAAQHLEDVGASLAPRHDLGWVLGKQGRFDEATAYLSDAINIVQRLGEHFLGWHSGAMCFLGMVLTHQGRCNEAREYLTRSLAINLESQDHHRTLEVSPLIGVLYETQKEWATALTHYQRCMELKWVGRHYQESSALAGICRSKHHLKRFEDIPPLLAEAEQLAQQYEYNDHLASLRLTQGHIAWEGHIPEWGSGFDAALHYYQHALIHALRFNRFMLDEVLWGGDICTPLRPIIPHCLERGTEGRTMLTALRDWWQTGNNDIGTPRPDTISPIPEDIPLLEAERLARQREPGDGSLQKPVLEQIEATLKVIGAG